KSEVFGLCTCGERLWRPSNVLKGLSAICSVWARTAGSRAYTAAEKRDFWPPRFLLHNARRYSPRPLCPTDRHAMGELTTIMARDGHEFQAYLSPPPGKPRGAIVVIQEIFGVNGHIRAVTDGFAKEGYTAIAPSLFDRIRRGIQLGYAPPEMQEGVGY